MMESKSQGGGNVASSLVSNIIVRLVKTNKNAVDSMPRGQGMLQGAYRNNESPAHCD
ncbi:hypothetical protein AGABI2DRAFT_191509 [Agaricus bisporus var. bisporus H97]|uniref:hypothetical protein n=1 Tax=Agaricus bisporus var. bisporus (strain H97 / ATCC MYA-4626 / FGSC 10389) TaxID=936046 RepID=UPI00029F4EF9|nr:hypothetical protein AGABI2DRAFT_191509 [Agaricus bisporus var. bisporus H97]EKV49526.1 hypothetical protein AGABI2DRAFT_191509 [Agaricus bisporus var. bisporus H97]